MNKRTLSLKRESLTELGTAELTAVAGGSHLCGVTHGPSIDQSCPTPTLPIAVCTGTLTQQTCITISPDVCVWTT